MSDGYDSNNPQADNYQLCNEEARTGNEDPDPQLYMKVCDFGQRGSDPTERSLAPFLGTLWGKTT